MTTRGRSYRYVGPEELRDAVRPGGAGFRVRSGADVEDWVGRQPADALVEPFTYVVDTDGLLRLAPRRSEHVACAGGAPVLAAGEIGFVRGAGRWVVGEVSNLSTGYCPDLACWAAVAEALDRAGVERPPGFTYEVVFRRCTGCRERAIVREGDFVCVFCGAELPSTWNLDAAPPGP
ncbi:hypothetical protein [Streptomyces boluensis]|uniref:Uncharacterized protein n=1 Tax=Streptomyces boluensis TaxID=1775135 RepID=A0A964UPY5_9ACTN|nr:hypothetical protein [Streptomyces boluensis]NBE53268.1 hypothetical protein [Streptomyces boluensis]